MADPSPYIYTTLPTFTVRTPKLAIFFVGTTAMGQVRSVNPSLTTNVSETDFARVGDDEIATVETTVKTDNNMTIDLYEKGTSRDELCRLLGADPSETDPVTLDNDITPFDCSICIYADKTALAEPEIIYTIDDFKPRSWSLTNDAESKDLLHRISGKIVSMSFLGTALG